MDRGVWDRAGWGQLHLCKKNSGQIGSDRKEGWVKDPLGAARQDSGRYRLHRIMQLGR